jgi:hypothetical protein
LAISAKYSYALSHDPEKACPALDAGCAAVFRKDHAQNNQSAIMRFGPIGSPTRRKMPLQNNNAGPGPALSEISKEVLA